MGEEAEKPTEAAPATESSSSTSEEVDVGRAASLLAQGKRNLLCGEVQQAVTQLQEAAELLGKKYGETAAECGEAYLCYGGALLELSRMESGVLGNALDGIETGEEEEEEKSEASEKDSEKDEEKPSEEEKEQISDQILDAMMETDEELKERQEKEGLAVGQDKLAEGQDKLAEGQDKLAEGQESKQITEGNTEAVAKDAEAAEDVKKGEGKREEVEGEKSSKGGGGEEKMEEKVEEAVVKVEEEKSDVKKDQEETTQEKSPMKTEDEEKSDGKKDEKEDKSKSSTENGETRQETKVEEEKLKENTDADVAMATDGPSDCPSPAARQRKDSTGPETVDEEMPEQGATEAATMDKKEVEEASSEMETLQKSEATCQKEEAETTSQVVSNKAEEAGASVEESEGVQMETAAQEADAQQGEAQQQGVADEDMKDADEEADNTEEAEAEAGSEELNTEEEGEEEEDGEEGQEEQKPEEEDVSNLQIAWEVLELAKNIFKRSDDKESQLKLAETLLKLGEVGLETESYDQALGDLAECLRIQRSVLEADDRRLAETQYQLGIAALNCYRYEDASASLKESVSVLQTRLANQKTLVEEKTEKEYFDPEDPVYKAKKEVTELQSIIEDIRSKLEDVEEEQRNAALTKDLVKDVLQNKTAASPFTGESSSSGFGQATSGAGTSAAQTDNITHLVRKKRKPEEQDTSPKKEEETTKKPRLSTEAKEPASSGQAAPEAQTNGHVTNGKHEPSENGIAENGEKMEVSSSPMKTVEDVVKSAEVGAGDAGV